jgi:hypothetical protein
MTNALGRQQNVPKPSHQRLSISTPSRTLDRGLKAHSYSSIVNIARARQTSLRGWRAVVVFALAGASSASAPGPFRADGSRTAKLARHARRTGNRPSVAFFPLTALSGALISFYYPQITIRRSRLRSNVLR